MHTQGFIFLTFLTARTKDKHVSLLIPHFSLSLRARGQDCQDFAEFRSKAMSMGNIGLKSGDVSSFLLPSQPISEEIFTRMVAAIGSGGANARNHRLVGDSPRLPVRAIPKWGTVTLTWPQNHAHAFHAELTRTREGIVVIKTGETLTEVALQQWPMPSPRERQRGIRIRMICAHCQAVRDALHFVDGEWRCRGKNCGNLSHASRHQQRYCPSIARRERLLRKLIRTRPKSLKARALRKMIARETRVMIAHLEKVSRDLVKRSQRHARHRRANPERTR
jgi:hypothetical protein